MVLLPSSNNESENAEIRVVGQSTKDRGQSTDSSEDDNDEIRVVGQSTKDRGPPPSPDVIEIVAFRAVGTGQPGQPWGWPGFSSLTIVPQFLSKFA